MNSLSEHNNIPDEISESLMFKTIMNNSKDSIYFKDSKHRFIYVNKNKAQRHGIDNPSEMIGKTDFDFISKEEAQEIFKIEESIYNTGRQVIGQIEKLTRLNGVVTWASSSKYPIYDNNSKICGIWGISRDITEQEQARQILKQNEEKYRRITENISDVIWTTDLNLNITYVSPSVEKLLGISAEEHKKRTLAEKFSPATLKKILALFSEEMERENDPKSDKNRQRILEAEYKKASGETIWASMHLSFIRNEEGKAVGILGVTRDITERKKAEDALRQNEAKFQLLFNKAPLCYQVLDINCRLIDVNQKWLDTFGYTREEVIGKAFSDLLTPDFQEGCVYCYKVLKEQGEIHSEFEILHKNRKKMFISIEGEIEYDPDGNKQIHCILQDITQRKHMEAVLKRERDTAKMYLNTAGVMFVAIDKEGKITLINAKGCEILGLSNEEIVGKDWVDNFIPKSSKAKIKKLLDKSIAGETNDWEYNTNSVLNANGEERMIYWHNTILHDDQGNAVGIFCSGSDITEHKQAEEALKKSEEKYSSYIENAPDGVIVVDENGRYIEVNLAASEMTGYSKNELSHMNVSAILTKEYLGTAQKYLALAKEKGKASGEIQFVHKDGSKRWGVIDVVKLSEHRFLCFIRDITHRKEAEYGLVYLSYHDQLTGLYNRRFFEEEAKRINRKRMMPLSIIMGDINGVKLINDAFGHTQGDNLIKKTAQIMQSICRENDILARTGGDEFSIILPKTDSDTACNMLKEIQEACEKRNREISNESLTINISLGCATKETVEEPFAQVMITAEEYMYKRKLLEHKSLHSTILTSIKATLWEKNQETEEHCERIVNFSRAIGIEMKLSQKELDELELLARLHDIGKIGISESILNKPGRLNEEEWNEMKKHPEIGHRIAMAVPELLPIAEYILYHHERWDGAGYPQRLKGDNIPLLSRILAVVDAYDAMTTDRPYRKHMRKKEAINEIIACAGTQFDPDVVKIFITQVQQNQLQYSA